MRCGQRDKPHSLECKNGVIELKDSVRPPCSAESLLEIIGAVDQEDLELHLQGPRGKLGLPRIVGVTRIGRTRQKDNPGERRENLLEELQSFCCQIGEES